MQNRDEWLGAIFCVLMVLAFLFIVSTFKDQTEKPIKLNNNGFTNPSPDFKPTGVATQN